jgi:hypothetical protein
MQFVGVKADNDLSDSEGNSLTVRTTPIWRAIHDRQCWGVCRDNFLRQHKRSHASQAGVRQNLAHLPPLAPLPAISPWGTGAA